MKRIYSSDENSQVLLDITPQKAGWKYVSFQVIRLADEQRIELNSGSNEVVIVPLGGRGRLVFEGHSLVLVRNNLFHELADIVYLPPRTNFRVEALGGFEFAVGGAPAEGRLPARVIRKEEIATAIRGAANAARGVSTLLDSDDISERLTVFEIHTPSGNWSSFPPIDTIRETILRIMRRPITIDSSRRTVLPFSVFTLGTPSSTWRCRCMMVTLF